MLGYRVYMYLCLGIGIEYQPIVKALTIQLGLIAIQVSFGKDSSGFLFDWKYQ
jgi:hypothetical protein